MKTIFLLIMSAVFFMLSFFIAIKENAESKIHAVLMLICLLISIIILFSASWNMLIVS